MKTFASAVAILLALSSMVVFGSCATSPSASEAREHLARGYQLMNAGNWQEAIDECTKAIELDPSLAYAYAYRGHCYDMLAQYDLAIADLNKTIGLKPGDELPYYYRGLVYLHKSNLDSSLLASAVSDFTTAITRNPKDALAYSKRAQAYLRQQQYPLAAADCNTILKISKDPDVLADASRMLTEANEKQQPIGFVPGSGSSGDSTALSPARGLTGTWAGTGVFYTSNILGERASKVTARIVFTLKQSGDSVTGGYQIYPTSQEPLSGISVPLVSGSGQQVAGTASITNLTLDAGGIVYGGQGAIEEWTFTFTTDTMTGGVTNLDTDSFTGLDSDPKAVSLVRQ